MNYIFRLLYGLLSRITYSFVYFSKMILINYIFMRSLDEKQSFKSTFQINADEKLIHYMWNNCDFWLSANMDENELELFKVSFHFKINLRRNLGRISMDYNNWIRSRVFIWNWSGIKRHFYCYFRWIESIALKNGIHFSYYIWNSWCTFDRIQRDWFDKEIRDRFG